MEIHATSFSFSKLPKRETLTEIVVKSQLADQLGKRQLVAGYEFAVKTQCAQLGGCLNHAWNLAKLVENCMQSPNRTTYVYDLRSLKLGYLSCSYLSDYHRTNFPVSEGLPDMIPSICMRACSRSLLASVWGDRPGMLSLILSAFPILCLLLII